MANEIVRILDQEKDSILAMLPSYIGPERWWALAVEVAKSPDLQRIAQSNPMSLIVALKKVSDWGLELDGEEALIIPYGDSAEPQAMWKGLVRRAIEAGVAAHIYAEIVREGDDIEIVSGSHRELRHKPNPFSGKKKIIGAYAVAILTNGLTDFEIFSEDDIAAVKGAALRMAQRRKKDAGESPAWRFFPAEMIKKSAIRRLCKRLKGKRDTEMGNRYEKVLATEPSFEASAIELPPDDLPTASVEMGNAPAPGSKLKLVAADAMMSMADQTEIIQYALNAGVNIVQMSTLVYDGYQVEDLMKLPASEKENVKAKIQAFADKESLKDAAHIQAGQ